MNVIILTILGLALLSVGAELLVRGASRLADAVGVSPLVIGLTVVAFGTSAPELAVSVEASLTGQSDIALGNVVGSNVFNIMAVLGAAGLLSGRVAVAPAALHFDIPVMVAAAVACLPIFFARGEIARWEGGLFLFYYAAYVTYLILDATQHEGLTYFGAAFGWFVIPLTVLGLGCSVAWNLRRHRPKSP